MLGIENERLPFFMIMMWVLFICSEFGTRSIIKSHIRKNRRKSYPYYSYPFIKKLFYHGLDGIIYTSKIVMQYIIVISMLLGTVFNTLGLLIDFERIIVVGKIFWTVAGVVFVIESIQWKINADELTSHKKK